MMEISLRDVPEQHVVSETRTVDQAGLEAWLPGAMARVADRARAAGGLLGTDDWPFLGRTGGPGEPVFITVYEGNPNDGPTPVEVCATVAAGGDRTIPAHREAYARITKSQVTRGELGGVYEAIEKWITENGLAVARAPRETYWTDFPSAGPDDEVFDVAFPVT
ncbi:GyrI-like domain-containing protein [Couchioplanes caeruleus]|uniref:GyrI-like domain-containing protein n=1 Tax=Couchioplanes caeruleus TaxID=56438 RepID=UPI0020BFCF32|nr:GyrI-like domain-containing protein [Couchioplanes caeruleus]UQU66531.1 GyrI-like domain-containing protein [Couchioplanes caeruleus]